VGEGLPRHQALGYRTPRQFLDQSYQLHSRKEEVSRTCERVQAVDLWKEGRYNHRRAE